MAASKSRPLPIGELNQCEPHRKGTEEPKEPTTSLYDSDRGRFEVTVGTYTRAAPSVPSMPRYPHGTDFPSWKASFFLDNFTLTTNIPVPTVAAHDD